MRILTPFIFNQETPRTNVEKRRLNPKDFFIGKSRELRCGISFNFLGIPLHYNEAQLGQGAR